LSIGSTGGFNRVRAKLHDSFLVSGDPMVVVAVVVVVAAAAAAKISQPTVRYWSVDSSGSSVLSVTRRR
jgi:hypothetical protein